jgi:RNA 2',3'-cyclic 3'-phosphodiesterase
MSDTLRTFIAIPLSAELRKTIGGIQDELTYLDCPIKWVEPKNIHLTLKFLGDTEAGMIDTLQQTLENLFRAVSSFNFQLTKLGAFPDIKNPRILWVGLDDNDQQIARLVSLLEKACEQIGFKKDSRPFSSHITVGRIRSPKNLNRLSEAINSYKMPNGLSQTADRIIFYKSTLTPNGPIYEHLREIPLV